MIDSQGRWQTKLSIESERTVSTDPSLNSSNTNFSIRKVDNTYIRVYTEPGDGIKESDWGATVYDQGGFGVKVGWNEYTYSYGPLSFTIYYQNEETKTIGSYRSFINNSEYLTRQVEVMLSQGNVLANPGNTFDAGFTVGNFHTPDVKWFNVRFAYVILNGYGYESTRQIDLNTMYTSR